MAASACRGEVKVVLIDTQYVVTDPMSFKSVVQKLTGKDSCVSWIEETSFAAGAKRKREADSNGGLATSAANSKTVTDRYGGPVGSAGRDWKLTKGLSFKDLDRMISEMPPMEELYQLYAQNNLL